jgi:hypothetical protein
MGNNSVGYVTGVVSRMISRSPKSKMLSSSYQVLLQLT